MLRDYRQAHSISADIHRQMLKDLGWTMEEYEVGIKG